MRTFILVFFAILIGACSSSHDEKETTLENEIAEPQLENFDWLIGKWKRSNDKEEGKTTFENWEKISETEYQGVGFAMQKGDTVSQENMKLFYDNEAWKVEVKMMGEQTATSFKVIELSDMNFICENNEIDFPNIIKYWTEEGMLKAKIANAEMEIYYEFERTK